MKDIISQTIIEMRIKNNDVYVRPRDIMQLYKISRTTVWRLSEEMRLNPKYRKAFRDLGYQSKLIHLASFEKFLEEKHNKYLRN